MKKSNLQKFLPQDLSLKNQIDVDSWSRELDFVLREKLCKELSKDKDAFLYQLEEMVDLICSLDDYNSIVRLMLNAKIYWYDVSSIEQKLSFNVAVCLLTDPFVLLKSFYDEWDGFPFIKQDILPIWVSRSHDFSSIYNHSLPIWGWIISPLALERKNNVWCDTLLFKLPDISNSLEDWLFEVPDIIDLPFYKKFLLDLKILEDKSVSSDIEKK